MDSRAALEIWHPLRAESGEGISRFAEETMNVRGAVLLVLLAGLDSTSATEHLSFRTRILPLLTKAGCNSGSCHGAAVGQGGFKLSLLGYDPAQDHLNITHELGGRRVDADSPAASLLLRKA